MALIEVVDEQLEALIVMDLALQYSSLKGERGMKKTRKAIKRVLDHYTLGGEWKDPEENV